MPIQVLCPGCKARFSVNEKFAGKKGPCPKCKTQITIPEPTPEVKIDVPEGFGPKDTKGKAVLEPIFREETKFSPVMAAGIGAGVAAVFVVALILRFSNPKPADKINFPWLLLALGAVLLAPPLAYGGYAVLRNDDLEPHRGQSLWIRLGICSAIYVAIWAVLWGIVAYLGIGDLAKEIWFVACVFAPMILLGAGAAFVTFDLEYFTGIFHYGFYLLVTVLLRLVIGLDPLLGPFKE